MRALNKIFFILMVFAGLAELKAQVNSDKIVRIEDGKMILSLDLRWNATQRYAIAKNFDIDSLAIEKAYKGAAEVTSKKTVWKVKKVNTNLIELYKVIDSNPIHQMTKNDIFIVEDSWLNAGAGSAPIYCKSGANKFKQSSIFSYKNGIATFFLPSYKSAQKVYISGSFNNWSTLQTPMQRVDSGWVARIKLIPGKYTYRYITDGKWREDPNNYIRENDPKGWYNSVIFCTNYEFHLKGRSDARKVVVAGSFNGWGFNDYQMIKTRDGWKLSIYLNEGTYAYKFVVDGQWITDPENKDMRSDGVGNLNSFIGLGDSYLFKLSGFTNAKKVILCGSFNDWNQSELLMQKTATGWQLPYNLAAGTYEYKFIVDGQWMTDPENPLINNVDNTINSVITFKPNYTFTLNKYPKANLVIVTGSFNGWSRDYYKMLKKDGKWVLPLHLKPGKHLYKFVVDGKWILDPDNKLWEENEYGTGNSVIWIEK